MINTPSGARQPAGRQWASPGAQAAARCIYGCHTCRSGMPMTGACLIWLLPGSFMIVGPGPGDLRLVDAARLEAVRLESEGLVRRCAQATARARATREQIRRCRSRREMLRSSAPAGRQAGLGCIPVVEQAKGIVMAQQGCRPEEAFDLLHRASQRANVQVYVLAAQVVEYLGSSENGSNVTPISLGAIRSLR